MKILISFLLSDIKEQCKLFHMVLWNTPLENSFFKESEQEHLYGSLTGSKSHIKVNCFFPMSFLVLIGRYSLSSGTVKYFHLNSHQAYAFQCILDSFKGLDNRKILSSYANWISYKSEAFYGFFRHYSFILHHFNRNAYTIKLNLFSCYWWHKSTEISSVSLNLFSCYWWHKSTEISSVSLSYMHSLLLLQNITFLLGTEFCKKFSMVLLIINIRYGSE
jgi:hypothetical protein